MNHVTPPTLRRTPLGPTRPDFSNFQLSIKNGPQYEFWAKIKEVHFSCSGWILSGAKKYYIYYQNHSYIYHTWILWVLVTLVNFGEVRKNLRLTQSSRDMKHSRSVSNLTVCPYSRLHVVRLTMVHGQGLSSLLYGPKTNSLSLFNFNFQKQTWISFCATWNAYLQHHPPSHPDHYKKTTPHWTPSIDDQACSVGLSSFASTQFDEFLGTFRWLIGRRCHGKQGGHQHFMVLQGIFLEGGIEFLVFNIQ